MKKNIWPIAIIVYFIVFITGIVTWVSFAMRHDDQLVRPDYYEHEIKYQDQIDRVARTGALTTKAAISYQPDETAIVVQVPAEMRQKLEGNIQLYRPSDARLDQRIALAPEADGTQRINVKELKAGHWKVRVNWKVDAQEYFLEKTIVLAGQF